MERTRKKHNAAFKAKVALAAIKGDRTVAAGERVRGSSKNSGCTASLTVSKPIASKGSENIMRHWTANIAVSAGSRARSRQE